MLALVYLIIFSIPAYLIRFSILGIPTTLFEVIVWASFIGVVAKIPNLVRVTVSSMPKLVLIGLKLIFIGALIGAWVSTDRIATLGLIKGFILTPMVAGLVVATIAKQTGTEQTQKAVINAFILSGILISLHTIWQKLTGQTTFDGRVLGIYAFDPGASPNYLALYLTPIAIGGIQNLVSGIKNKKILSTFYLLLSTLSMVIGIYLSGSRAALAISLVLTIYIIVREITGNQISRLFSLSLEINARDDKNETRDDNSKKFFSDNRRLAGIGAAIILIGGMYWMGKPDLSVSPDSGRVSSSNNIRYEIWKTSIVDMLPKYWLTGTGLGQYQLRFGELTRDRVNYPEFITPRALAAHNIILSSWFNLGLIGLIGMIMVVVGVLQFQSSKLKAQNSSKIVLLTILLLGLVDTPIFKNDLGAMFYIMVFLAVT